MRRLLMFSLLASAIAVPVLAPVQANPLKRLERAVERLPVPAARPSRPTRPDRPDRPVMTPTPTPAASAKPAAGGAFIADQGVHNAVHAAHQSQIVFLRKDLGIGAITEGDIVSDFTLGQPMFFRVFTEKSAVNAIAAANNVAASSVYADGVRRTPSA